MVKSATSFSRSGVRDWLLQRVSAIIITLYTLFLAGYVLAHPHLSYMDWRSLFSSEWMRIATLLTLISIFAHAYIGIWTISTDYLTACTKLRVAVQVLVWLALLTFVIWGIIILWGR
jgi:succinate dehydrogenase / fumarate reductase membrane anchor subunit